MGVHFQRGAGVRVAQARGHCHDVDAVGQQNGGVGVPEIVKADAFKAVGIGEAPEPFRGRVVVEPRTIPAVNDPPFPFPEITGPGLYLFLIFSRFMKHRHHAWRQRDQPLPRFCFSPTGIAAGLRRVDQRAGYVNGVVLTVHVG